MPRQKLSPDDKRRINAFSKRLAAVARRHSQAEIARRTGVSRANVSRYLRGTRVPIDFCMALTEQLNVNPAWLIAGEGAPDLADTHAGAAALGDDLLELVKAMEAVERMKLGALAGKQRLKTLKELNETMRRYEELRTRLNHRTEPVFRDLVERCIDALQRKRFTEAGDLLKAIDQAAPLCQDEALQEQSLRCRAAWLSYTNQTDESIAIQNQLFRRMLARSQALTYELARETRNMVVGFLTAGRAREARAAARATLALCEADEDSEMYHKLECALASAELAMGELGVAMGRYMRHHVYLSVAERGLYSAVHARLLLLSGSATWTEVAAMQSLDHAGRAFTLLPFAMWTEDPDIIARACDITVGTKNGFPSDGSMGQLALLARDILQHKSVDWRAYVRRKPDRDGTLYLLMDEVSRPWIARLGQDRALARKLLPEAINDVNAIAPNLYPSAVIMAIHHRNVLLLVRPDERPGLLADARRQAERFYRDHVRKGFRAFQPALELIA